MYKVFIQNNSISFIDPNQAMDLDGIFLFEQSAISRKKDVLSLLQTQTNPFNFYVIGDQPAHVMETFFSDLEQVQAAGGVVTCDGKVLLIHRHGKWDLPKGKVEKDESTEEAAIREVTEETGVTGLTISKRLENTFHTYNTYGPETIKKTAWFVLSIDKMQTGTPQIEEGITEVKWVAKEELKAYLKDSYGSLKEVARDLMINV